MAFPVIAAAIAGAAIVSAFGASKQQKDAGSQSRQQMDFQERMSSTAYQRGMADMKKAGLNPLLAYKQGGATSPAGAMAPTQNIGKAAVDGATQGLQMASAAQQYKLQTMQNQKFQQFGNSPLGNTAHSAHQMLKAGYKAGSSMTVEKVSDLTGKFKAPNVKAGQTRLNKFANFGKKRPAPMSELKRHLKMDKMYERMRAKKRR